MVLGEGAAVCCLELGQKENALAFIEGIGYATEILEHNISISAEAICFQKSMRMAINDYGSKGVFGWFVRGRECVWMWMTEWRGGCVCVQRLFETFQ